jgi:ribonuclease VapC
VVLDSSALIAVWLMEPGRDWVQARLRQNDAGLRMSWVNAAEVGMSCERKLRGGGQVALEELRRFRIELLQPDFDVMTLAVHARRKFPLNFGDCFAYAHAKLLDGPLLTPISSRPISRACCIRAGRRLSGISGRGP